jgi:hypothetical protein
MAAWDSVAAGAAAAEAASRTATKILVNMLHRRWLVEIWRDGSSSRDLGLDGHEVWTVQLIYVCIGLAVYFEVGDDAARTPRAILIRCSLHSRYASMLVVAGDGMYTICF